MGDPSGKTGHSGSIGTTAWRAHGSYGDILDVGGVESGASIDFAEDDGEVLFGVGIFETTLSTL